MNTLSLASNQSKSVTDKQRREISEQLAANHM